MPRTVKDQGIRSLGRVGSETQGPGSLTSKELHKGLQHQENPRITLKFTFTELSKCFLLKL